MATNPYTTPEVYNYFTLDGVKSPGFSRITSGGERKDKWEAQQSPNFAGAYTVFRGEELATLEYQIELWKPEHFAAWDPFIAKLRAGRKVRPPRSYAFVDHRIEHNEIKQVTVNTIGAQQILAPTKWWYKLGFTEYKKPKPIGGPIQPPRNEREEKIAALNSENAALGKQIDAAKAAQGF